MLLFSETYVFCKSFCCADVVRLTGERLIQNGADPPPPPGSLCLYK